MKKVCRIGTVLQGNRRASIYIKAEMTDDKLSISGVIGPLPSGNALGGCGQIDMEFAHRFPEHNDPRTSDLIRPDEINFAPGWDRSRWLDLLDIWHRWHLNDMRAECEHQRAMGWTYAEHHDPRTFKGDNCPVCGYSIGSKWLKEELPQDVIDFIAALPATDREPAWV